jgi:hypothetical protein
VKINVTCHTDRWVTDVTQNSNNHIIRYNGNVRVKMILLDYVANILLGNYCTTRCYYFRIYKSKMKIKHEHFHIIFSYKYTEIH